MRLELHGDAGSIAVGMDTGLPLRSVEPGVAFPGGTPHAFFTVADAMAAGWVAEAATLALLEHRPVRLTEVVR